MGQGSGNITSQTSCLMCQSIRAKQNVCGSGVYYIQGLKLILTKCQMQVKISGEYMNLCKSPGRAYYVGS